MKDLIGPERKPQMKRRRHASEEGGRKSKWASANAASHPEPTLPAGSRDFDLIVLSCRRIKLETMTLIAVAQPYVAGAFTSGLLP